MQAYFGRAKAACLCSYCCNRHLCYDGGRLGRVKLYFAPIFSPLFEFQHALSLAKHSRARRKRLHCRLHYTHQYDISFLVLGQLNQSIVYKTIRTLKLNKKSEAFNSDNSSKKIYKSYPRSLHFQLKLT